MFEALKPQKWTILVFFFQTFFSTKCAPFLLKIGEDLILIIRRAKGLELKKFI